MRHRNMYNLTGLPGWMRFGQSSGRGGPGPCAQFLRSGQWPTPQMAAASQGTKESPTEALPAVTLASLGAQAQALEDRLRQLNDEIARIKTPADE